MDVWEAGVTLFTVLAGVAMAAGLFYYLGMAVIYAAAWAVRVILGRPPKMDEEKLYKAINETVADWEPGDGSEWDAPEKVRAIIRRSARMGIRRYVWLHDTVPPNLPINGADPS